MCKKSLRAFVITLAVVCTTMLASTAIAETQSILQNPGFESGEANWKVNGSLPAGVTCTADTGDFHSGTKSYKISNGALADTMVIQTVNVEKDKVYKVSFWIKAVNIKNKLGSPNITMFYVNNGAGCKGIYTSKEINSTDNTWIQQEFYVRTLKDVSDPLTVALRLGGQGTTNEGTVYFDDVSMELVENPPSNVQVLGFYVPTNSGGSANTSSSNNNTTSESKSSSGSSKTILLIVLAAVVLGVLVFAEFKLSKRKKTAAVTDPEGAEAEEEADAEIEDEIAEADSANEDKKDE